MNIFAEELSDKRVTAVDRQAVESSFKDAAPYRVYHHVDSFSGC